MFYNWLLFVGCAFDRDLVLLVVSLWCRWVCVFVYCLFCLPFSGSYVCLVFRLVVLCNALYLVFDYSV